MQATVRSRPRATVTIRAALALVERSNQKAMLKQGDARDLDREALNGLSLPRLEPHVAASPDIVTAA